MSFDINYSLTAPVFNIQSYSIHDGPGIRATVFLKGCPLRCVWCANPESNAAYPELMTYSNRCTGCGACIPKCPKGAIALGTFEDKVIAITDREKCINCGACVPACHNNAREIAGKNMTVREVLDQVLQDRLFMEGSGGGMTVSGGEVLAHAVFSANLLAAAKAEGIHTCVESTAFASRETIDLVFPHVDLALLDVKHMDSAKHKEYTGVENEKIHENIRHIHNDLKIPVILRVPTIPGYNDDEKNFRAIGEFAASLGNDVLVNLLPYHRLGESKSESLGRPMSLGIDPPADSHMQELKAIVEEYGVSVRVGG